MAKRPKPNPKAKPAARAVGRPRIGMEDLREGWKEMVIDAYEEGATDIEVSRVVLRIGKGTFNKLLKEDKEFSDTVQAGREYAEAWYMKQLRKSIWSEVRFNYQSMAMTLRNRFGYDAKQNREVEDLLTEIVVNFVKPKP